MDDKIKRLPDFDEKKLWIGNLDTRVTEYQLLKLVQMHGSIKKLDMMFHHSGLLAGQPRGYAFVTFDEREDAVKAKNILHGKLIGHRNISVRWAYKEDESVSNEKPKLNNTIPALAMTKDVKKADRVTQIQAIEEKLRLMEHKGDELKINDSIATKPPIIQQFQFNKDKLNNLKQNFHKNDRHKKPYLKKKPKY